MKHVDVDIVIIGSGMAGLYSAYQIKQFSPDTSFLILEKYKKNWVGGRTSNDHFYGTEIMTGAGVGRKAKDKLLYKLLQTFQLETHEYMFNPKKSALIRREIDIMNTIYRLREEYPKYKDRGFTFKQYATHILGMDMYVQFVLSSGYSDYENEDAYETLYHYGIDDNTCCWKIFSVPWKRLVMELYDHIGEEHFRFSNKATSIRKVAENPCQFLVETENGGKYMCNRVIVATTISGIRSLLPNPIYNDIEGQPFLRLYAKFNKESIPILKEYVKGFTLLPGPLQKIIPMDANKGVYMIAYNDNKNALELKPYLENNEKNRKLYEMLLEKSLGIQENSLHIIAIKDYYWPIGTHYYKPLNKQLYRSREEFIEQAQHPQTGIVVVGEVVSRNQGWTEGALQSVKAVITRKWVNEIC